MNTSSDTAIKLEDRGILYLTGGECRNFLQNIITNNVDNIKGGNGVFAALLTPQGKYLFDFFLVEDDGNLILDCHQSQREALLQKLKMYKLRADVNIIDISGEVTVWSTTSLAGPDTKHHISIPDPRHESMGWRLYLPATGTPDMAREDLSQYKKRRISLGIPEGPIDLEQNKRFIMEANFEELNGLDFKKGCYVGQEINARMKHRGTLKKRILPIRFEGAAPAPNTAILMGDKNAVDVLSAIDVKGLALLRLERLEGNLTLEDGTAITPHIPDWLNLDK